MSGRHPPATTSVMLFTRDLRVHDNPALAAAAQANLMVPLFVLDPALLGGRFRSPNRAWFLAESLRELDRGLRRRGGGLVLRSGDTVEQAARVARQVQASELHLAHDVSAYATRRVDGLRAACGVSGCAVVEHPGVNVVPDGTLRPQGGDHFKVFTPYWRAWRAAPRRPPVPAPRRFAQPEGWAGGTQGVEAIRALAREGGSTHLPLGGEPAARRLVGHWLGAGLDRYAALRDSLSEEGTSRLSPYLHFGCVSPTELARRIEGRLQPRGGGEAFLRQLCWRDFHHQVLAARQDLATTDYRPRGDHWRDDAPSLQAWKQGSTGYPIVDAGMRQLRSEGWMHNRARLIVASFLVKDLRIDWRRGAAHFFEWLVDGDLASNAGNWQWVAGTGNDTRPNRILNPLRQAYRFDPQGDFVRHHVPELRPIEGRSVHQPWLLSDTEWRRLGYPSRIVDHAAAVEAIRLERVSSPRAEAAGEPGQEDA